MTRWRGTRWSRWSRSRCDAGAASTSSTAIPLTVDVHFRDSHLAADAAEDILHEYTLQATVDPTTLVVLGCEAQARTLPWPECPNALASATRIAGEPVAGLRAKVHADFRGTTTCTHLNDVLRSLAGVSALARGQ